MKRYLLFGILVAGVLLVAVLGWAVDGARWALTGAAKGDSGALAPALS
jgi:hypothetical protein